MVLKKSAMPDPSLLMPAASLFDVGAREYHKLLDAEVLVIAIICNHCPYVLHIKERMIEVLNSMVNQGSSVYAISGNDPLKYPEDAPDFMRTFAMKFNFRYLFDEDQSFLKAIGAECTPEFYIFKFGRLFYHGRFDSSSPGNSEPVTGIELLEAYNDLSQYQFARQQLPSQGCSIKWR